MKEINFFGQTNFRNTERRFGIKLDDRRRHFYVIGKTGMGKTEMLKNMAVQDIQNGYGMGFVDPHGEAVEELLDFIPEDRVKDVIYFNPSDTKFPIAFNVMESVDPDKQHMIASGLMSVFKKIWPDVWSARMEYILNNVILALLESPDSTLLGINRMLTDPEYRQTVVEQVNDPVVKTFWLQEYSRYTQRYEVEATAAIQNKVGQFISNPLVRNIVGQVRSSVDLRKAMDERKIVLVDISKGRIGEDNSRLLGGLLITKLQLAAMSRVDMPEEDRQDFFLYIDEFQHFATESFVNILSEARKYRLALILSHQYVAQLGSGSDAPVRDAVFGNVGTLVSFRVGAEDAEVLEKEFSPEFLAADFVNLGKYTIYVKLMIDGVSSRPFSARTLPPPMPLEVSERGRIIQASREQYGTALADVEEAIAEWSGIRELAAAPSPTSVAEGPVLYDARCSNCGKDTKVVFPPDGKRPVYCKSCRKKLTQSKEKTVEQRESKPAEAFQEIQQSSGSLQERRPEPKQAVPAGDIQQTPVRMPEYREQREERPERRVSLAEAIGREPAAFSPQRRQQPRKEEMVKRREEGRKDLQELLRQAIQKPQAPKATQEKQKTESTNPGAGNSGVLKPGETIYFEK